MASQVEAEEVAMPETNTTDTTNHEASTKRPAEADTTTAKQPKYKRRKHMDPKILQLRTDLHQCCKYNDLQKAWGLFQMALRENIRIEAVVLYNLLSLCDGLGDRHLHVGTPRCETTDGNDDEPPLEIQPNDIVPDETRCEYAKAILTYVQEERKLPLTENAYTGLTRLYARAGNFAEAEECLDQAERTQQCRVKLRLYSPLLLAYAKSSHWTCALKVWLRLCRHNLALTEKEYACLLAAPYFARVLADLAEDVMVPAKNTVDCIRSCLLENNLCQPITDEMEALLGQIPSPELQSTLHLPKAKFGWIGSDECSIDRSNGMLTSGCMKRTSLRPVVLEQSYVETMLEMNERIVLTGRNEADTTPFQGGGKGKKRELTERDLELRRRQWQRFRNYMTKAKETKKISVVIDGANVGYHEQNFKGSAKHVNYEQIDSVVQQFDPKTIMLVLHVRHCQAPLMPGFAQRYMDRWKDFLYQTPSGMNDDWFWLHAALETDSMVLSNDHMRDHHFQMVTPRSFLRWRDRHQIYFQLMGREIGLRYPDPYSRRIQLVDDGLIIPMPKRGDESRFLDGTFVADDAPEDELYVCFRPKRECE